MKKPPLGIMPERIHRTERISELIYAISRYRMADKWDAVMLGWVNELQRHIRWLIKDAPPADA